MSNPVQSVLRDHGADLARLRWLLAGVLLALLIPTLILASRAYDQLGYESLHRYRLASENIAQNIESGLGRLLSGEASRAADQFTFYQVAPSTSNPGIVSPLAQLAGPDPVPGVVGYFVISAAGALETPLLPPAAAISELVRQNILTMAEVAQRQQQRARMEQLLGRLAQTDSPVAQEAQEAKEAEQGPAEVSQVAVDAVQEKTLAPEAEPATAVAAADQLDTRAAAFGGAEHKTKLADMVAKKSNQQVFERLAGNVKARKPAPAPSEDSLATSLSLNQAYVRRQRQELQAKPTATLAEARNGDSAREFDWFVQTDSALQFLPLGDDHLLLYRRSWQTGPGVVLGMILEQQALFAALIDEPFMNALENTDLRLTLTDGARPLRSLAASGAGPGVATRSYAPPSKVGGELLYRSRLPAPLSGWQLVFSADQVGLPPGGGWIIGSSLLLVTLLLGGFALIYRLGVRELDRRATQQNFVSAVSHELKTPLTAIRMYGEMLKGGWVSEEKKPGYYEFIFSESERLSRLISNVLRLSQISRDRLALSPQPHRAAELVDIARSKLQSLAEGNAVSLDIELPPTLAEARVNIDMDAFVQVLINLVDNAIKFAGTEQRVAIALQGLPSNLPADRQELRVSVRDFGPGVPKAQLGRIFDLFYRGEGEMTRQTQGTGIGLALVAELVAGMHGRVEVANVEPGACFSLYLPLMD